MPQNSFDAIVSAARKQIAALEAYDKAINHKINAIKDAEWDKPLSKAEIAQINKLRADKAGLLMAIEEIGYVTLGALDKTDEVKRIANALTGVVKDLTARTKSLEAAGTGLKKLSTILTSISDIAGRLNKLAGG